MKSKVDKVAEQEFTEENQRLRQWWKEFRAGAPTVEEAERRLNERRGLDSEKHRMPDG